MGQLLAQVHFGELEGTQFPATVGEARAHVAATSTPFSHRLATLVSRQLGIFDDSSIKSNEQAIRESFEETLLSLLRASLRREPAAVAAGPNAGTRLLPIGTLLLDDLKCGPRVQAQMWAESHVRSASKALRDRGATNHMNLNQLSSVDPDKCGELILAYTLLGVLHPTESILALIEEPWKQRVNDAGAAFEESFGVDRQLPTRLTISPTEDLSSVADSSWSAETLTSLQLLNATSFYNPLMEAGALTATEILDRIYLPLRIHRGGQWGPKEGMFGRPTAEDIDDDLKRQRQMAPVYFPFILRPLAKKESDPSKGNGYLIGEEDFLYVTDPGAAYPRRLEQISWIRQFGYWGN